MLKKTYLLPCCYFLGFNILLLALTFYRPALPVVLWNSCCGWCWPIWKLWPDNALGSRPTMAVAWRRYDTSCCYANGVHVSYPQSGIWRTKSFSIACEWVVVSPVEWSRDGITVFLGMASAATFCTPNPKKRHILVSAWWVRPRKWQFSARRPRSHCRGRSVQVT